MKSLKLSTAIAAVIVPMACMPALADNTSISTIEIRSNSDSSPDVENINFYVGGGSDIEVTISESQMIVNGAADLNAGLNVDGATTLDQTTIAGSTSINGVTSITGATSINTSSATTGTTIGGANNTTSLLSDTINVGTQANTSRVSLTAGNADNDEVTVSAGGQESFRVYTREQTGDFAGFNTAIEINAANISGDDEGADIDINAGDSIEIAAGDDIEIDAADKAIVRADRFYVNVSPTSGDAGNIGDAGIAVAGNDEEHRWVADDNGMIRLVNSDEIAVAGNTAAMVVENPDSGNHHGLVVQEGKTTLSGGTNSASLTLDDRGATFSDPANGRPIQVHGVADGTEPFDAVNVRQLYSGLASVLAASPEIRLQPGESGFGIGLGAYGGYSALGVGFGHMYDGGTVIKGSVAKSAHSELAVSASLSWTW